MSEREIRILVVEDDKGHAGLIRRAFSKAALATRLTLVDSVREASELLKEGRIDLVLADLVLPDGRGMELLASEGEQERPVVIMTSHGDETAAVDAMKAGALDYIVKSQASFASLPRTCESILRRWDDIVQRRQAERALRDSEERFRLLYEASPLPYQSLDAEGCLIEVNPAWSDLLGYEKQEVLGRRGSDFLDTASVKAFEHRFPRFLKSGDVRNADFVMVRKDGTRVPVEVDGRIGRDEHGDFKQTHCIVRDVTERVRIEEQRRRAHEELERCVAERTVQLADANSKLKQEVADRERTEATLRASLTLHDAAQTATSDEVIQWCLDEAVRLTESEVGAFYFVEADREQVPLFARSTSTSQGHEFVEFDWNTPVDLMGVWLDAVRQRCPVIHNDSEDHETPLGRLSIVRELVVPILEHDRVVALIGVGNRRTDYGAPNIEQLSLLAESTWVIIQRMRAEEELKQHRDHLEELVGERTADLERTNRELHREIAQRERVEATLRRSEASLAKAQRIAHVGSYSRDFDGGRVSWSEEMRSILGCGRSDAPSLELMISRIHPEDRDKLAEAERVARETGEVVEAEYRIVRPDGALRYVRDLTEADCAGTDRPVRMFGALLDITDRKLAEQALRESETRYRLMIENQADLVVKFDRDGRLLFASPSYCDAFGREAEDLVGKPFPSLGHDERETTELADVFHPPHSASYEEHTLTKGGPRDRRIVRSPPLASVLRGEIPRSTVPRAGSGGGPPEGVETVKIGWFGPDRSTGPAGRAHVDGRHPCCGGGQRRGRVSRRSVPPDSSVVGESLGKRNRGCLTTCLRGGGLGDHRRAGRAPRPSRGTGGGQGPRRVRQSGQHDPSANLANVPWIFSCTPDDNMVASAMAGRIVVGGDHARVLLVTCTDHDSRMLTEALRQALEARNVHPVRHIEFRPGAWRTGRHLDDLQAARPSCGCGCGRRCRRRRCRGCRVARAE